MKSTQKQHIHHIIFICLLMVGGWGQECDEGYVWIDEIPDFVETDYYCFYQEDLDVLQSIIDSNENLFGQYPFQTGLQIWENGRLSTLEFYWYNQLTLLPDNFGNLSSLKTLWLFFNQLTSLPESIGNLSSLENFELSWSQITDIPESIGNLSSLKSLSLTTNPLTSIPESIGYLTNLEELYLQSNQLTNIPESISNLSSLQSLHISDNQLIGIPENIGSLSILETLHLSGNQITNIPESIGNLLNLQILYLHSNQLLIIPESICNLNLEWNNQNHFNIHVNQICPPYPECIEDYMGFQDTSECEESSICIEGEEVELWGECYNIEETTELFLYNNQLTGEIPPDIGSLTNLIELHLFNNQLTGEIPSEIGNLTNLTNLRLYTNELTGKIPVEIGDLTNLEYLYLDDNQLTGEIPESMCNLSIDWDGQGYFGTDYFSISNNQLCPPYPSCLEDYIGYQDTTNCSSLSISELTLPINYQLHQPFPNPFNPTTSISFSIPEQSQTSLKVYDIKGNLISTLLNQTMNVGHHHIEWIGENLSSGTYFIRINSGEFSDVKKVVLVK